MDISELIKATQTTRLAVLAFDRNARSAMAVRIYDIVVREFPEATIDDSGADPVVTTGEHSITLEPDCFHCTGPYRTQRAIERDWLRRVALKVAGAL